MRSINLAIATAVFRFMVFAQAAGDTQAPTKPGQESKPAAAQPAAPVPIAAKTYVGSNACEGCHDDILKAFKKDPHKTLDSNPKGGQKAHACEGCHGPASLHVDTMSADDVVNPARLSRPRADESCLACHRNQTTQAGRLQSGHAKGRVACMSCHRMHQEETARLVASKTKEVNEQCARCHSSVWASFQQPHAHRLAQAAMSCVDCHNPHGSFPERQVRTFAANEPGCFKCHSNLRGPFTYEHVPMRTEGCQTCHEAHGSANPKMLTRADVRFVCLECHANLPHQRPGTSSVIGVVPPAFHDLRSRRYQNCTVCHQKIHGSHVDRSLLR